MRTGRSSTRRSPPPRTWTWRSSPRSRRPTRRRCGRTRNRGTGSISRTATGSRNDGDLLACQLLQQILELAQVGVARRVEEAAADVVVGKVLGDVQDEQVHGDPAIAVTQGGVLDPRPEVQAGEVLLEDEPQARRTEVGDGKADVAPPFP